VIRRVAALLTGLALVAAPVPPATAQEPEPEPVRGRVLEVVPAGDESAVVVDGRRYGGRLRVTAHREGLAVVEDVSLDGYLAGIQEVPFDWEPAALEAQAIAARTYLAWTLARGRTESGEAYDYDICATVACQVYAGLEPTLAENGDRWRAAVEATDSQILVYDGAPAQTYYSSTSGGRTRTVSDVWPDIDLPYLVAVDSPGEDSPFVEWMWRLPQRHMQQLTDAAGLTDGELIEVDTQTRADGEGPWTVTFHTADGEKTVDTWTLRNMVNGAVTSPLTAHLPAVRPDGARYPQAILSPTFRMQTYRLPLQEPGAPPVLAIHQVVGRGWGHQVGMSQYGAQAMAERGATAAEILAHYYGGLTPVEAPQFVPEDVEVALALEVDEFTVGTVGPVDVYIDGYPAARGAEGGWSLTASAGSIEAQPPVRVGLPPRLRLTGVAVTPTGVGLRIELNATAEVSWEIVRGGEVVESHGPDRRQAGHFTVVVPLDPTVSLRMRAVNDHGGVDVVLGRDDPG